MSQLLIIPLLLLFGVGSEGAKAEGPTVRFELGTAPVYRGQSRMIRVIVEPAGPVATPEFAACEDFELEFVDGPVSASDAAAKLHAQPAKGEQVYRYRLTPRRVGTVTIPVPQVRGKEASVVGSERRIEVLTPASQDLAFLQIRSDRSHVYPMQQFTITLMVAIRELPEPFQEQDPLDLFSNAPVPPPRLQIPWVDSQQVPAGIVPLTPWETWLEPLRSNDLSGLRINQVGERSVQAVLENRAVTFHPPAHKVVHPDQNGIENRYWQYEFSRRFLAEQVGDYTFGPVTLMGDLAGTSEPEKGLVYEAVAFSAGPVSLVVQRLPEAGRPASYIGAIGRFSAEASLSSPQVKLGDPLFLKLRVHGQGSLGHMVAPDLSGLSEVARDFRVYEATQVTGKDEVCFTYPVRPLHAGIQAFPSIPVSYFDVEQEKYVVLNSSPVPLEILPAASLSPEQIVIATEVALTADTLAMAQRERMFGNITLGPALRNDALRLPPWGIMLGGLVTSYLLAVGITALIQRRREDRPAVRRRAAPAEARQLWREARCQWEAGHFPAAATQVEKAFVALVAGSYGVAEVGLTRRDICSRLGERGIDSDLRDEVGQLLEACDAVQFGGSRDLFRTQIETSRDLVERLIRALKHPRRQR